MQYSTEKDGQLRQQMRWDIVLSNLKIGLGEVFYGEKEITYFVYRKQSYLFQ